jgi:hypothetical protein
MDMYGATPTPPILEETRVLCYVCMCSFFNTHCLHSLVLHDSEDFFWK